MQYAIFGDIHSSMIDYYAVQKDIQMIAPKAQLVALGDLFECTISKKKMYERTFQSVVEVMILPKEFQVLMEIQSVIGNQEERILFLTRGQEESFRRRLEALPEIIQLQKDVILIHGHQWLNENEAWRRFGAGAKMLIFGHTHEANLSENGISHPIVYEQPYVVKDGRFLVNVGPVIGKREWLLYDTDAQTITFHQAASLVE